MHKVRIIVFDNYPPNTLFFRTEASWQGLQPTLYWSKNKLGAILSSALTHNAYAPLKITCDITATFIATKFYLLLNSFQYIKEAEENSTAMDTQRRLFLNTTEGPNNHVFVEVQSLNKQWETSNKTQAREIQELKLV